jgi:hypothetical protein
MRSWLRWLVVAAGAVLAMGAVVSGSALAAYGPGAEIVSVDNPTDEQANGPVGTAVMTPDGRYVVFQTQATNFFAADGSDPDPPGETRIGGVFRYDRLTGDLQLVADGDLVSASNPNMVVTRGAANPSVSDDGRYVAFSTGQQLVAGDTNNNVDVYVRDMNVPLKPNRIASGAYTLVSALDGGDTPASYMHIPNGPPVLSGQRNPGSEVWPRTAISADGRYVAFRTVEWNSNLPSGGATNTPPGQVLVRDLLAKRTALLTLTSQPGAGAPLGSPAGSCG